MPAIDIHAHAFPDDLAGRAIEQLTARGDWQARGDGTIDGLLHSMDQANIDVAVFCAVATRPKQAKGIFKWQRKIYDRHCDRLVPFGSIHPRDKKPRKWARKFAEEGFAGIKLHPMYQDFVVDDEEVFAIYEAAVEYDLVVAVHSGRDIGFENDKTPDRASPKRLARVLKKIDGIRLLCTHMGGWQMWDEVEEHLLGKDVAFETSFSAGHLEPDRLVDLIRRHGIERVCFGTDWPWRSHQDELAAMEALGLDGQELRRVLLKNAARLLRF